APHSSRPSLLPRPPRSPLFPTRRSSDLTTLLLGQHDETGRALAAYAGIMRGALDYYKPPGDRLGALTAENRDRLLATLQAHHDRSEEHTSELQSPDHLVCRLLLEKKNTR